MGLKDLHTHDSTHACRDNSGTVEQSCADILHVCNVNYPCLLNRHGQHPLERQASQDSRGCARRTTSPFTCPSLTQSHPKIQTRILASTRLCLLPACTDLRKRHPPFQPRPSSASGTPRRDHCGQSGRAFVVRIAANTVETM